MAKIKWFAGYRLETISCGWLTVVEKLHGRKYKVRFDDGYERIVSRHSMRDRKIKNPYAKVVCGVGFLGEGIYKCYVNSRVTKEYSAWVAMLSRCYRASTDLNKSYADKTVCEDWHNFQNFAEWCQWQNGFTLSGWTLDKDLLKAGNREYSPDYCCFLPKSINSSLHSYHKEFLGCNFNHATNFWKVSYVESNSNRKAVMLFKDELQGRAFYNENRFNYLKYLTSLYKNDLDTKVISRLEEIFA